MAGPLTAQQVTLGDSATDSQNFRLRSNNDGTLTLARGVNGALGSVLTVDASGNVTLPANVTAARFAQTGTVSMIRLNGPNGFGSTSTGCRRFSTVVVSQGSDITYADSATDGATFTINTAGVYAMSYTDAFSAAADMAITLNPTLPLLASGLPGTMSQILFETTATAAAIRNSVSGTVFLAAGSIIKTTCTGAGTSRAFFTITRVS